MTFVRRSAVVLGGRGSGRDHGTPSFLVGVIQPGDERVKVVKKLVGAKPYAEFKAARRRPRRPLKRLFLIACLSAELAGATDPPPPAVV